MALQPEHSALQTRCFMWELSQYSFTVKRWKTKVRVLAETCFYRSYTGSTLAQLTSHPAERNHSQGIWQQQFEIDHQHLSFYLSVCLCVCLPFSLSVCLSVCVCVCLSACVSDYLPVSLSICLFVCVCLSACLSVYLSVCQSVCISLYIFMAL